jgi:hypothetical protein
MEILLAFAPFIVFVIVERWIGIMPARLGVSAVSALTLIRDVVSRKPVEILELGTFILFVGLSLYARIAMPAWSIIAVRLRVDAGLLLVVLSSLALRRPFTLQLAREQVPQEVLEPARLTSDDLCHHICLGGGFRTDGHCGSRDTLRPRFS